LKKHRKTATSKQKFCTSGNFGQTLRRTGSTAAISEEGFIKQEKQCRGY